MVVVGGGGYHFKAQRGYLRDKISDGKGTLTLRGFLFINRNCIETDRGSVFPKMPLKHHNKLFKRHTSG